MKHAIWVLPLCMLAGALWGADSPPADAGRGPLRLSLKRAVEVAVSPEGNARIQISQELLKQARARSAQARSALLPDLESLSGMQNATRSLNAQGLNELNLPFGIQLPERVGPFNIMDVRASVGQNVLDLSAVRRLQAAHGGVRAARSETANTEEQVRAQVAKAYLAALRTNADVEAVQANLTLSQAVLKQTEHQKQAGFGTGIEVTRARVMVSNEQQRLLVVEDQRHRAYLQLLRVMNLPLDVDLELTDRLTQDLLPDLGGGQEAEALAGRADLTAQEQREDAARVAASAVALERLPSLVGYMDYGTTGVPYNVVMPTRTVSIGLRVPLFDGGRREARRAESLSQYRTERIKTGEMREQIKLEVRLAQDSLRSASAQVQVAAEGLSLAENELQQARRRYEAGVANSLEVTDAQTRLERARDNQIAAVFNYNMAKIELAQARGDTRRAIP